jgi:catechol 2,3-dioxygenase-like lactoylglutathione lyase family enzyme
MSETPELVRAIPRLPCLDVASAVEFYASRLGFAVLFRFDDYAAVMRDGIELHLWLSKDKKLPKSSGCRIEVRAVDALFEECKKAKVLVPRTKLEAKSTNSREFDIQDGDGNTITFSEDPSAAGGA